MIISKTIIFGNLRQLISFFSLKCLNIINSKAKIIFINIEKANILRKQFSNYDLIPLGNKIIFFYSTIRNIFIGRLISYKQIIE